MGEFVHAVLTSHSSTVDTVGVPTLSSIDEAELRWYFGLDLPAAPGSGSSFGPTCARLQNARTKTTERTGDEVPWTEIVFCGHAQSGADVDATEDAMHDYIDARRRATKLRTVLERLSALDYAVLEARFSVVAHDERLVRAFAELAGVVLVTEALRVESVRRAANDQHETVRGTVLDVVGVAKNPKSSKIDRVAARAWIARVRREAEELAAHAVAAFVRAKRFSFVRR